MITYTFKKENKDEMFDVNVELINNNFVNNWVKKLELVTNRLPNISWYTCMIGNNDFHGTDDQIKKILLELFDCFKFFDILNLDNFKNDLNEINRILENLDLLEQSHLNKWHRYFTKLEFLYSSRTVIVPNIDFEKLYFNIQEINRLVHRLECRTYYKCPRRKEFVNPYQYAVQFTNANVNANFTNDENHSVWSVLKHEVLDDNTFDFFTENYNYTVWMNEDILGKDQIKAWLDHDNLNEEDITGNLVLSPNVTFDPSYLYKRVLENEEFRRESKLSGKYLNRPPLGNIIEPDSINWKEFPGSTVVEIKLNNTIIWKKYE